MFSLQLRYFSDSQEGLAWGTAQIHCYESSALQDKHSTGDQPGTHEETSLNALATSMGNILFASDPKILFCDLRLAPGENKTCKFILDPINC